MSKHHPFGPSSLYRRSLCPASYRIEKYLEDVESEAALKGTYLHALIEQAINSIPVIREPGDNVFVQYDFGLEAITSIVNSRIYRTNEERRVVLRTMKFIASKLPLFSKFSIRTEQRLEYKDEMGNVLYFGTSDMVVVDEYKNLYIFDWKTGRRDEVALKGKRKIQLKGYALAAMQTYEIDDCKCFVYNPVQNKRHTCTIRSKEKLAKEITTIINTCKAKDAPTIPGEEQCRYCLGKAHKVCPEWIGRDSQIKEEAKRYEEPIKKELPATKQRRIVKVKNYDLLPKKEVSDAEGCMFGFMWGCMPIIIFIFLVWLLKALS